MNEFVHMAGARFPYGFSSRNLSRLSREGITMSNNDALTFVRTAVSSTAAAARSHAMPDHAMTGTITLSDNNFREI
jgi:hypothetical protein